MVRLPQDRDKEPSLYTWTVLIVAAVIVCLVLGALMTIGAIKLMDELSSVS